MAQVSRPGLDCLPAGLAATGQVDGERIATNPIAQLPFLAPSIDFDATSANRDSLPNDLQCLS